MPPTAQPTPLSSTFHLPIHLPTRHHSTLLFLHLLLVISIPLYAFTFGFFLTRYQLLDHATCSTPPHPSTIAASAPPPVFAYDPVTISPHPFTPSPLPHGPPLPGCWLPATYSHAILLLIDALRYNFTLQLPTLHRTLATQPHSTLLLPFIADPPTVTLQRLSALTTGSLPTFIDFASNFQPSHTIQADNLIEQVKRRGDAWRSTFMGDDTWLSLYPHHFSAAYPYPSFNVKDLHTVDRGCIDHLLPTLHRQRRDGVEHSVVIAHFLGVDHVGHRYHAAHDTMADKLREMDGIIADVVRFVDERPDTPTVLLVFGDHGMTQDGNHGGATPLETTSALFVHASQPFLPSTDMVAAGFPASVAQVDFVPSLALLLGLPIPFGALGSIIPQLFASPSLSSFHLLAALYVNAFSVWRYLSVYQATAGSFDDGKMAELGRLFVHTADAYARLLREEEEEEGEERVERAKAVQEAFRLYLAEAVAMCRDKWATFNLPIMAVAIASLVTTATMLAALLFASSCPSPPSLSSLAIPAIAGGCAGVLLNQPLSAFHPSIPPLPFLLLTSSLFSSAALLLWLLFPARLHLPSFRSLSSLRLVECCALLCVLGYMQGLFTNSYIIHEPHVVFFMAMSILLTALPSASTPRWSQAVAVLALRLTREVGDVLPSSSLSSTFFSPFELLCIVASLAAVPVVLQRMAVQLSSSSAAAPRWVYLRVVPAACALCLAYWSLQSASSEGAVSLPVLSWLLSAVGAGGEDGFVIRIVTPHLVYASSYTAVAVLLYTQHQPLPTLTSTHSSSAPQRKLSHSTPSTPLSPPSTFTGRITTAELTFALFAVLLPSFLLLLGPKSSVLVLLALLVVHHHPFHPSHSLAHLSFLFFLSLSLFFSSSHSQAFSSLQISAAFIGFDAFHLVPAGVMLACNTFAHLFLLTAWVGVGGWRACAAVLWLFVVRLCCTMLNAMVNRRHLMVWEIFAPKFVFDGLSTLVIAVLLALAQAAASRASGQEERGDVPVIVVSPPPQGSHGGPKHE